MDADFAKGEQIFEWSSDGIKRVDVLSKWGEGADNETVICMPIALLHRISDGLKASQKSGALIIDRPSWGSLRYHHADDRVESLVERINVEPKGIMAAIAFFLERGGDIDFIENDARYNYDNLTFEQNEQGMTVAKFERRV